MSEKINEDLIYKNNWKDYFNTIHINESVKDVIIEYKGIEYKFDLEKVLKVLCKEVEHDTIITTSKR